MSEAASLSNDWGEDDFRELGPVHRRGLSAYKTLPRAASMANLNCLETHTDSPISHLPTSSSSPFLQLLPSPRANSSHSQSTSSHLETSRRESEPISFRSAPLATPHRASREASLGSRPNSRTLFPLLSPQALSMSRPSFQDMFPVPPVVPAVSPPAVTSPPPFSSSSSMASLNAPSSLKSPPTGALPKSSSLDSEGWNEIEDVSPGKISANANNTLKNFVEADEDYGDLDLELKRPGNGPAPTKRNSDEFDADMSDLQTAEKSPKYESKQADDEEEDWDREFEVEQHKDDKGRALRALLKESEEVTAEVDDAAVPAHLCLLNLIQQGSHGNDSSIVTYPVPSRLHTLRTSTGHVGYNEQKLAAWLASLVTKHAAHFRPFSINHEGVTVHVKDGVATESSVPRPNSPHPSRFTKPPLEPVIDVPHEPNWGPNLDTKKSLVYRLRQTVVAALSIYRRLRDATEATMRVHQLIHACFSYLEQNRETSWVQVGTNELGYGFVRELLLLCAKLLQHDAFKRANAIAISLFPTKKMFFDLLALQTAAHKDGTHANHSLRGFCGIYLHCCEMLKRNNSEDIVEVACEALTSINFYLTGASPLNATDLVGAGKWALKEGDAGDLKWLDAAFDGEKPNPSLGETEAEIWRLCGDAIHRIRLLREFYPQLRHVTVLKARCAYVLAHYHLYGPEPTNGNFIPAEELLFESLYLLDHVSMQPTLTNEAKHHDPVLSSDDKKTELNSPIRIAHPPVNNESDDAMASYPVISELGKVVLMLYGEVLLKHSKYQYAVAAFESAGYVHLYRTGMEWPELDRQLCNIVTSHHDIARARVYYAKIIEQCKQSKNLDMFVFLVERYAKLEAEQGNFDAADVILKAALDYLTPLSVIPDASQFAPQINPTPPQDSANLSKSPGLPNRVSAPGPAPTPSRRNGRFRAFDAPLVDSTPRDYFDAMLEIRVQMARLCLDGGLVLQAITELENLTKEELPHGQRGVVNLLLANAYTKKRMFSKARTLMQAMQDAADEEETHSKGNGESSELRSIVRSSAFMQTRAKIEAYSGCFAVGLKMTDLALSCDPNMLQTRGKFMYRKGKIYQALLYQQLLQGAQETKEVSHGSFRQQRFSRKARSPSKMFSRAPSSTLEYPNPRQLMESLSAAYHYFVKVDDTVMMAKSLLRLSESFLHVAFQHVAVQKLSSDSLLPWLRESDYMQAGPNAFSLFLAAMEESTMHVLELCVAHLSPLPMLQAYLTMAEIRFLQNRKEGALTWWSECTTTFFALFVNGNKATVLANKTTPGFCDTILRIYKRMTRLLMAFEPSIINRRLGVLEAFLQYDMALFSESLVDNRESVAKKRQPDSPVEMRGFSRGSKYNSFEKRPMRPMGGSNDDRTALEYTELNKQYSDKVCFCMFEMSRQRKKFSANTVSAAQLLNRNHAALTKILQAMSTLRKLTIEAGRCTHNPTEEDALGISSFSPKEQIWRNLFYSVCLDNVVYLYAPVYQHFLSRNFQGPDCRQIMSDPPRFLPTPQFVQRLVDDFLKTKPPCALLAKFPNFRLSAMMDRNLVLLPEFAHQSLPTTASNADTITTTHTTISSVSTSASVVDLETHFVNQSSLSRAKESVTNSRRDQELSRKDQPQDTTCEMCNCEWFADHPWNKGFCRSCFHKHRFHPRQSVSHSDTPPQTKPTNSPPLIPSPPFTLTVTGSSETVPSSDSEGQSPRFIPALTLPIPVAVGSDSETNTPRHAIPAAPPTPSARNSAIDLKLADVDDEDVYKEDRYNYADDLLPPVLELSVVKELFRALDRQTFVTVFTAILGECKLLFHSADHFRLKAVITSLLRLIYPFSWRHVCSPLLGEEATKGLLKQEMPFLIGVDSQLMYTIDLPPHVIAVDLDQNIVTMEKQGLFVGLPEHSVHQLYRAATIWLSSNFLENYRSPWNSASTNLRQGSRFRPKSVFQFSGHATKRSVSATKQPETMSSLNLLPSEKSSRTLHAAVTAYTTLLNSSESKSQASAERYSLMGALKQFQGAITNMFAILLLHCRVAWDKSKDPPFELALLLHKAKLENMVFLSSFVRTRMFAHFVMVRILTQRVSLQKSYLFDCKVREELIKEQHLIAQRCKMRKLGMLHFSMGDGSRSYSKRLVLIEESNLTVFKAKASKLAQKAVNDGAALPPNSVSLTCKLHQGVRLLLPAIDMDNAAFSLSEENEPEANCLNFRCENEPIRMHWVQLIEARIMSSSMKERYERAVGRVTEA